MKAENIISISVIRNLADWCQLSGTWDEIWANTPDASVFNSFPFLYTCWSCLKINNCSLYILVLRDQKNQVIGLAPLMQQRIKMSGLPIKSVSFIFHNGLSDRPQFLFPQRRAEQLRAVFRFMKKHQTAWDVLDLSEQDFDSTYEESLRETFHSTSGYHTKIVEQPLQPYLTINEQTDTWEKYLATRSKNHRKKWNNKRNRLNKSGEITITRHHKIDEIDRAFQEYRAVQEKSRKRNHISRLDDKVFSFYRELSTQLLSAGGGLHILFLRNDGVPITGRIGLAYRNRYAFLQTVFDNSYDSFSPGFLIGGYDIQWVIENGFTEYDFMSGFLSDKLLWTDTVRKISFIRVARKNTWGGLFYLMKFFIVPAGVRVMNRFTRKQSIVPTDETS